MIPRSLSASAQFEKLRNHRKSLERRADKLLAQKPKKKPSSVPSTWATDRRAELLAKSNKAEEHIETCLKPIGFLYTREYALRHNKKDYFIDFVVEVNGAPVAIEVDGGQHFSPKGQKMDRARERNILASGEANRIIRMSWAVALSMNTMKLRSILNWASECPSRMVTLMY